LSSDPADRGRCPFRGPGASIERSRIMDGAMAPVNVARSSGRSVSGCAPRPTTARIRPRGPLNEPMARGALPHSRSRPGPGAQGTWGTSDPAARAGNARTSSRFGSGSGARAGRRRTGRGRVWSCYGRVIASRGSEVTPRRSRSPSSTRGNGQEGARSMPQLQALQESLLPSGRRSVNWRPPRISRTA
jgi:hypothetical protein